MEKEPLFKLTSAVYRVTELVPEGEPLRILIRSKALAVLFNENKKQENIEVLLKAFELAQEQGWVLEENFLILTQGYEELKNAQPKKEKKQKKAEKTKQKDTEISGFQDVEMLKERDDDISRYQNVEMPEQENLKDRQQKLVEVLREKGRMQVGDLEKMFPEVTKRTLRRDMVELTSQEVVKRIGQGIRTYYQISKTA